MLEILKLTEASLTNDRVKAMAYATQLAEKMDGAGESKAAERLRKLLAGVSGAPISSASAVMERLPVDSESRLALADQSWVSPDESVVYFPTEVERVLTEFLDYVKASDKLIAEGVGVSASLLAYGPPGCGKTELARWVASRLGLPLVTARTDTLVSSYLGSTSKNLRVLFDHVSSRPCVLFLDEFDAIAKLRDDRHELGELKRVVVSLLQNLDAVRSDTVILAATNHEHLLDPAIWRRFSYRLQIPLPDHECREKLFSRFLAKTPNHKTLERFATASSGMNGSDIREVCEAARRLAIIQGSGEPKEADVLRRLLILTMGTDKLSIPDLIHRAKETNPEVYTHRVLAEAFGMSASNVSKLLRKFEEARA